MGAVRQGLQGGELAGLGVVAGRDLLAVNHQTRDERRVREGRDHDGGRAVGREVVAWALAGVAVGVQVWAEQVFCGARGVDHHFQRRAGRAGVARGINKAVLQVVRAVRQRAQGGERICGRVVGGRNDTTVYQ